MPLEWLEFFVPGVEWLREYKFKTDIFWRRTKRNETKPNMSRPSAKNDISPEEERTDDNATSST